MMDYTFSDGHVVDLHERIGVDVRPPVEISKDGERFQQFSKEVRREFPELFDRMVLGDQQFEMLKTFRFPGKPHIDARTFVMTPRGPVFAFPRRIGAIDVELDLPKTNETFVACMRIFLKCFPGKSVFRIGKINEYIFKCDDINSLQLVSARFSKMDIPEDGEIKIRANLKTTGFNRIFTIEPARQFTQEGQYSAPSQTGFCVKVVVDFNNDDVRHQMKSDRWLDVLKAADLFARDDMYRILNRM